MLSNARKAIEICFSDVSSTKVNFKILIVSDAPIRVIFKKFTYKL